MARFRLSSILRRRQPPAPLSCRELVELVSDYLEGALSDVDRVRFERHIAGCPHCTAYLEQMRATVGTLRTLGEEAIPTGVREELMVRFRDWSREQRGLAGRD